MKQQEMDRFIAHCDRYFRQDDCTVLHDQTDAQPHIDVLVYKPNDTCPFWKLVTMGASDFAMSAPKHALGNRNEYMMFVDAQEDLTDRGVMAWYYNTLMETALYSLNTSTFITYGHSIEWGQEDTSDMVGAFIEMPQIISDVGILRCKLGLMKQTVCLQVVTITRDEADRLLADGPQAFSEYLYPEKGRPHFLCQRYRDDRF